MFLESFKGVSDKFQGCVKVVSKVFLGTFKGIFRVLRRCFKQV